MSSANTSVDENDFHWLIGILEGEGTFVGASPATPGMPLARVVMTDRDVVDRVGAIWHRAVIRIEPRMGHYKMAYATTLKGTPAVELMQSAREHLSHARREQLDRAIATWHGGEARRAASACSVQGCGKLATRRGLCKTHYQSWWRSTKRGGVPRYAPSSLASPWPTIDPDGCSPECDLQWLAGLLEGEGSFSVTYGATSAYPVIALKMCSKDVVDRAADVIGATGVHPEPQRDPSWKITYRTSVSGAQAADWMQRLRPMMGERRRAAIDAALDGYYPIRLPVAPEHCVVPGCLEPHRGRGLCHKHYMSWLRDRAKGRDPRVKPLRSN